ncbi:hypothetical protein Tco_0812095 [Tanacetum coccineum]
MQGEQLQLEIREFETELGMQILNLEYFKDKMLLMQAQDNGVVLDEEQLLFIAGGQDNTFDDDVDEPPIQDLLLNAPTAQTMFMANVSSADPFYDKAGPSYDSDILSEIVTYVNQNRSSSLGMVITNWGGDFNPLSIRGNPKLDELFQCYGKSMVGLVDAPTCLLLGLCVLRRELNLLLTSSRAMDRDCCNFFICRLAHWELRGEKLVGLKLIFTDMLGLGLGHKNRFFESHNVYSARDPGCKPGGFAVLRNTLMYVGRRPDHVRGSALNILLDLIREHVDFLQLLHSQILFFLSFNE